MKKPSYFYTSCVFLFVFLTACQQETIEEPGINPLEAFAGTWEGEIVIPMQPLPIEISVENETATLSIPIQGIFDEPFNVVNADHDTLSLETTIQDQTILFSGERDGDNIQGEFTQLGQNLPFQLRYMEEEQLTEISLESTELIKAKVDVPENDSSDIPVALILPGSGPTDKHGNSYLMPGRNDNLKRMAEHLNDHGIATIRYDKRGIGDNLSLAPNSIETRFDDYITDAQAWLRYAQEQESFSSVHLIGHSEGALVGLGAALQEGVQSYSSVAGAGRTIDEILVEQLENDPFITPELLQESADIIEQLVQGDLVQEVSLELESLFNQNVQPFLSSWMAVSPVELIEQATFPTYIIHGNNDQQIPVDDAYLLHEANQDSELYLIDQMGHGLRNVSDDIEEESIAAMSHDTPLSEELLTILTAAILDNHTSTTK
ncbi:alpha/beta hydrolase [Shouchella miscanthi]|uniref:alpha/beta hydrolase n=1 Tax=Shouchella miscanthi TaxID=2598861 RepID=UPI0011A080EE|nr:alpha/beta fold hydrolase [Shouchella miscanthi]